MWGWAATVCELFIGRREWSQGVDAPRALERVASGAIRPRVRIPGALLTLLSACLTEDVKARPRDMLTIATSLREVEAETRKALPASAAAFRHRLPAAFYRLPPPLLIFAALR